MMTLAVKSPQLLAKKNLARANSRIRPTEVRSKPKEDTQTDRSSSKTRKHVVDRVPRSPDETGKPAKGSETGQDKGKESQNDEKKTSISRKASTGSLTRPTKSSQNKASKTEDTKSSGTASDKENNNPVLPVCKPSPSPFLNNRFAILNGEYPGLRIALRKRNWSEVTVTNQSYRGEVNLDILQRVVYRNSQLTSLAPAFIWTTGKELVKSLHRSQIVSKFNAAIFTTKVGLAKVLSDVHWFAAPSDEAAVKLTYAAVTNEFFPRCYIIGSPEDRQPFIRDYILTASFSVVRWLVEAYHPGPLGCGVEEVGGEVCYEVVETALENISIVLKEEQDIDKMPSFMRCNDSGEITIPRKWLNDVLRIVQGRAKLELTSEESVLEVYNQCYTTLETAESLMPQMRWDGINNIWIVKPGARSCGRGILVLNRLDDILAFSKPRNNSAPHWPEETRYVVQKYIERPMLIHGCKFDIRQWFVVTDWSPLVIWMYRESYLRFCSRPYSLSDLRESVHLNNYAVQKNYTMECSLEVLPVEKMWDSTTFRQYLSDSCGLFYAWDSVIYPGMRDILISTMLCSQEHSEPRPNSFEVYGADFMLTEDCRPWLIEINNGPDLSHSTSVTARLVPQMFEDLIKVTIDKPLSSDADTGLFECVFRQPPVAPPISSLTMDLRLVGSRMRTVPPRTRSNSNAEKETVTVTPLGPPQPVPSIPTPARRLPNLPSSSTVPRSMNKCSPKREDELTSLICTPKRRRRSLSSGEKSAVNTKSPVVLSSQRMERLAFLATPKRVVKHRPRSRF